MSSSNNLILNKFDNKNEEVNIQKNESITLEIERIKNNVLFKDLNLETKEIRENFTFLNEIINETNLCNSKEATSCFSDLKNHLHVIRDHNNKLYFFIDICDKFKDISPRSNSRNFLYNYYKNTEISKVCFEKKYFKNIDKSYEDIINKYFKMTKEGSLCGMYIYGDLGVGKTHLLFAIANSLAIKKNKTIAFVFLPEYINIVKKGFNSNSWQKEYADDLMDIFKESDVLFIDDIGTEFSSEWFYIEYLFNILNYRMNKNKLTFFSSNLSLNELETSFYSKFKEANSKKSVLRLMDRIRAAVNNENLLIRGINRRYDKKNNN
ncbi:MAG: DnaA ATPase domain-containing protein [Mycoplasmoidaceae bacterium]